jgi:hypothetical protein
LAVSIEGVTSDRDAFFVFFPIYWLNTSLVRSDDTDAVGEPFIFS